jgi:hypothetical protein
LKLNDEIKNNNIFYNKVEKKKIEIKVIKFKMENIISSVELNDEIENH